MHTNSFKYITKRKYTLGKKYKETTTMLILRRGFPKKLNKLPNIIK